MHRRFADQIDPREYSKVDCPVCAGTGRFEGDDCPVCGWEEQIDRIDLERIDVRDYEDVECPICEGAGRLIGDFGDPIAVTSPQKIDRERPRLLEARSKRIRTEMAQHCLGIPAGTLVFAWHKIVVYQLLGSLLGRRPGNRLLS